MGALKKEEQERNLTFSKSDDAIDIFGSAKSKTPAKKGVKDKAEVEVPGLEAKLIALQALRSEISDLESLLKGVEDEVKTVSKEKFLELYKLSKNNPKTFLIKDGTGCIMVLPNDKYISIDEERANQLIAEYGEDVVNVDTKFYFTPDVLQRNMIAIQKLIMDADNISVSDKQNLLTKEVKYSISKGAIDHLYDFGKNIDSILADIQPIFALKNCGGGSDKKEEGGYIFGDRPIVTGYSLCHYAPVLDGSSTCSKCHKECTVMSQQELLDQIAEESNEGSEEYEQRWEARGYSATGGSFSESGYTIKGRKGRFYIDDVERRIQTKFFETLPEAISEMKRLSAAKKARVHTAGPSIENLIEADRFYSDGGTIHRANNSPALRYANFNDGSFVNLVRLKPYKTKGNGVYKDTAKYAVSFSFYNSAGKGEQQVSKHKTLDLAEKKFNEIVALKQSDLIEQGTTGNYEKFFRGGLQTPEKEYEVYVGQDVYFGKYHWEDNEIFMDSCMTYKSEDDLQEIEVQDSDIRSKVYAALEKEKSDEKMDEEEYEQMSKREMQYDKFADAMGYADGGALGKIDYSYLEDPQYKEADEEYKLRLKELEGLDKHSHKADFIIKRLETLQDTKKRIALGAVRKSFYPATVSEKIEKRFNGGIKPVYSPSFFAKGGDIDDIIEETIIDLGQMIDEKIYGAYMKLSKDKKSELGETVRKVRRVMRNSQDEEAVKGSRAYNELLHKLGLDNKFAAGGDFKNKGDMHKYWNKRAEEYLTGKTVRAASFMKAEEAERLGWDEDEFEACLIVELTDGTIFYVSHEGNGPGFLSLKATVTSEPQHGMTFPPKNIPQYEHIVAYLPGCKIETAKYLDDDSMKEMGWSSYPVTIEFSKPITRKIGDKEIEGKLVVNAIAQADPEGNDGGALFIGDKTLPALY